MELTEILDKWGKFIEIGPLKECHEKGLFHRTVGIFIFNEKGELLLQKRSSNMTFFPKRYDLSSSGHVSNGEDIEHAIKKELGEELGIKTNIKLIAKDIIEEFDQEKFKVRHFFSFFEGTHEGPFKIQKEEVDSAKFFSIDEIKKMIETNPDLFTLAFKLCFKFYVNKK